ncbi:MAG: WD40/YVTN/BNR-like repeat-containing protein, partial [Flavobacteriales bacterium]
MNQISTIMLSLLSIASLSASAQWTEVEWEQLDGISNIDFADDETGYAQMHLLQGFTSSFEQTEDGGQTWTEMNIPVNSTDIQDMNFYAPGIGAFVARVYVDGEILTQVYSTNDDGANWENISPDEVATGYGMSEIQMLDPNTIFFVIDDYFYRTINGG